MGPNITIRYMDDSSTSTSMAARYLAQKIKNTIPDGSSGQIDIIDYDNKKAGFIIYTIAGSEGSYGGLISLVHNNKIEDLIVRGVERAKNCPNDPICINEPAAHCFACLDLPETSCVKFNDDLNRKYFLDRYFSDLASPQVGNTKPVEQPAETQNQVQKTGVQPVTQSTTDQTQDTRRRDIVL